MLVLDKKSLLKVQISLPLSRNLCWWAIPKKNILLTPIFWNLRFCLIWITASPNNLLLDLILLDFPCLYPMVPLDGVNIVVYGKVTRLLKTEHVMAVEVIDGAFLLLVHDMVAERQLHIVLVESCFLVYPKLLEKLLLEVLRLVELHPERVLERKVLLNIIWQHVSH